MGRLDPIAIDHDDPRVRRIFDVFAEADREPPMLYRLLGNAPAMLEAWVGLAWPLRHGPTTSRGLRELLIMRVALLTEASYEWRAHWPAAIQAGVSPEQLVALGEWSASDLFSPAERAALRCTDEMIGSGAASAGAVEELRVHFDDSECVELILTPAFYSCVSHTLLSLGLEASDPGDGDEALAAYRALTG